MCKARRIRKALCDGQLFYAYSNDNNVVLIVYHGKINERMVPHSGSCGWWCFLVAICEDLH